MHHPVVSWCVVVGGGEGVVQIVHEGHVRGGGWLLVVGDADVPRDVMPEVAEGGHPGYPCFPLPLFGVAGGGAGRGRGNVGLAVAAAALGVHPLRHGVSEEVLSPVDGGHRDPVPRGGRALTVWGGEWGAVMSGDVEEGVKEEFRTPSPRVAAWTRVIARMRWVVLEVWRRRTSWSPSSRRCCRTAAGLCRA